MNALFVLYIFAVISGLVGLWLSGDWVVTNAIAVAHRYNVSTFFLGFVILALAADIPELAITISSAMNGVSAVALGDIIGGNFSDVTMVVGSALLLAGSKIQVSAGDKHKLLGILLITSTIMLALLALGSITKLHGLILVCLYVISIIYFWKRRDMHDLLHEAEAPASPSNDPSWLLISRLVGGLVAVMGASHLTVNAALGIADFMNLPPETIGATILGVGTTLPELALCLGALRRGDFGLAIGPTLGTVLGQTTLILGTLALLSDQPVPLDRLGWACAFMFVAFGILAMGLVKRRPMGRGTGAALVSLFITYLAYQVM